MTTMYAMTWRNGMTYYCRVGECKRTPWQLSKYEARRVKCVADIHFSNFLVQLKTCEDCKALPD